MRILHVDKFLPARGGVGSYISAVESLLTAAGHEVLRFGCDCAGNRPDLPQYIDLRSARGITKAVAAARMFHNRDAARKLDDFLRVHRVDVAHLHNIYHHLSPSILSVLRRHGVAAVMTAHDYRLLCPAKHFFCPRHGATCTRCIDRGLSQVVWQRCEDSLARCVLLWGESLFQRRLRRYQRGLSSIICPTSFMREELSRGGFPDEMLVELPNPVAVPAAEPGPQEADMVLFAGRLSIEKGTRHLPLLARQLPKARILVAGDGPEMARLQQQHRELTLDNLCLLGHQDHPAVATLIASAAVVIVPSDCFEVSPQTMLEAMSAGRCVIAPNHGAFPAWVRDGETGRLFRPGDSADLARVVDEMLRDLPRANRLGSSAAELVRARHDGRQITSSLLNIYERAIQCASR